MDISFSIRSWKISKDEKTNNQKIVGTYDLSTNGKILASQSFNEGYSSIEVPFSGDLIHKVQALEQDILSEIRKMLA